MWCACGCFTYVYVCVRWYYFCVMWGWVAFLFSCDVRLGGSNEPSPTPATQKPPAERRRARDARGTPGRTSDPFAVHQVPRLPRKSHRQSGGNQGTPEGRQRDATAYIRPLCSGPSVGTPGRTSNLFACTKPKPATQKPPAKRQRARDARGTLGRTSDPFAVHQAPRLPRKSHRQSGGDQGMPEGRQRDARAYIRPLCSAPSPAPATQKPPAERAPEGRQGVHPTPLQVHQVPRLPRKSHRQSGGDQGTPEGRQRDARAYMYVWVRCVWVCGVCDWDVWCMCSVSDVCVSDGEWVSGCLWDVCVSKWCVCVWVMCVCVSDECVVCVCVRVMILTMCVRVSVCVCDVCVRETCVSEDWEDRREEEEEADTALKTKTPHVNVGKKPFISQL